MQRFFFIRRRLDIQSTIKLNTNPDKDISNAAKKRL